MSCLGCGMDNCVCIRQARMPSAYDREQQALHDRLDAALRRIEALELEVARLNQRTVHSERIGPGLWNPPDRNRVDETVDFIRNRVPPFTGPLGDCPASGKHGPNPDGSPRQCPVCKCISGVAAASPATAYPPLPDEGT